jgi:DNA-binding transcriptional ArsR family regulator
MMPVQDVSVVRGRPDAVPRPDWVLLYRAGLSRKQIAELTGAPPSTVSYHLASAKAADPALKAAHAAAAGKSTMQVPRPGLKRMDQVIAMVQATGRYPLPTADAAWERKLAGWLRRRRRDANMGILDPAVRDGLAVLPDWHCRPGHLEGEALWQDRLKTLIAYRAAGHDWPRRKRAETDVERELGEWLNAQRFKLGRGTLSTEKAVALDTALPGWRAGRKRGGKPWDLSSAG